MIESPRIVELPADGPLDGDPDYLRHRTAERRRLQSAIESGPSAASTKQQLAKGKLTVRQRIELILDASSFVEIEPLRRARSDGSDTAAGRTYTDGVVAGWGTVDGRTVYCYAQDFRILGGSLGEAHAQKIHKTIDLALSTGSPVVAIYDGAGARIQEGVLALDGFGRIFRRNVQASGVIPQFSVMVGPSAGGAAYAPALTDFILMVRGISEMYITGPDVIRSVTGEQIDRRELGGADAHATKSGVATSTYDSEAECFEDLRYLLSLLPSNNREFPPSCPPTDPVDRWTDRLFDLIPADVGKPYDVREVIGEIVDHAEMFEVQPMWARNVVCALARLGGEVVGLVANQPMVLAGVLDIEVSQKAARFVQMCDSFNIPLVTLCDTPGFLPGSTQEHGGIIRHGAALLYAYCEATVPRIQLILRKAYGGAYIVMDSRSIGADLAFALPSNEIAVMGAEAAVNVIHRKAIAAAEDPEGLRDVLIAEYRRDLMNSYHAAEHGMIDDVIDPASTRIVLIRALASLRGKRAILPDRKHGNQPR